MSRLALYRKYRSSNFAEVVGQAHVVTSLTSALVSGRLSHAYLFTGPRGVGKTSVARLLARSLNCTAAPAARPCGKCDNCLVAIGSHLDLIEIDAASNRRIDEIRDLREKIGLAPAMGKYKVYIIDEVHMLTTEAFNALLKTLEEPPSHAVFILATTEAHKVPATITSRTQRFSFKPITAADLKSQLAKIAKQEKIQIDQPALELLAQASRGSLRDAISLLDQVASHEQAITADQVRDLLGWGDQSAIEQLAKQTLAGELAAALATLDRLQDEGAPVHQVINQLIHYFRQAMHQGARQNQPAGELNRIIHLLEDLISATKSPWPELALEAALARSAWGDQPAAVAIAPATTPVPEPKAQPQTATAKPAATPRAQTQSAPNTNGDDTWLKALMQIKNKNNSLYALLRSTKTQLEGDQLVLTSRFNFHRQRLEEPKNRSIIEAAITKAYGKPMQVVCQLEADTAPKVADRSSELVSSALEIFGGEIVE